jgi:hypothetical protein
LASTTAATLAGLLAVAHLRDAARKALASIVRANQESPRAMEHKHGLLIGRFAGTKRMFGRATASQMAAASAASFLPRLT